MNAIERACDAAGGQTALARHLGITLQAVNKWVKKRSVPAERVLAIEEATGGRVTRHELRPDLYPPEERSHAA